MIHNLALITGATGGLGKALSHLLAEQGISLLLTARNEEALKNLADELRTKTTVKWIVCDFSKNCDSLLEEIGHSAPDLVINNAGFGVYGLFDETKDQAEMIDVNIKAPVLILQKTISTLKERGKKGVILNVSSAAGYYAMPYFATYAASKACLRLLSEAVDEEYCKAGIRVLVSCPGQINTPFRVKASHGKFTKMQARDIPVEKAAKALLRQIERGERVSIIDWRYRLAVLFSHFLPRRWLQRRLAASILERI